VTPVRVLALDTSTWTASAAIVDEGGTALAAGEVRTETHSDNLLALVADVVARAGIEAAALDAVAVGAGPGSFTGLRIGLATAKGVAFAAGRPLWAVSSLAALALDLAGATDAALLIPVLDARRGEVFAGFYRRGGAGVVAAGPEQVLAPGAVAAAIAAVRTPDETVALAGDGLAVYPAELSGIPDTACPPARTTPSAPSVARLALAGERADVLGHGAPVYIRPSEAEVRYPDGVPGALRKATAARGRKKPR
jgi:tRNA threonylcarbamoyladenosine biosynthesis protein TsaB